MNVCLKYSKLRLPADSGRRLDCEFKAAIGRGAFSGASLLISRGRAPDFEREWGTVESGGAAVNRSTRFDLASLTKPLVTAPLCMAAVERGLLNLDDTLSRFFPGSVPTDKEGITVKSLLSHSSGLPAYEPFYFELIKLPPEARPNALASMILQTALDTAPGRTTNYSDLGFILLGLILERQMGGRLDRLARDFLFAPLGIDELHFCPIDERMTENGSRKTDVGEGTSVLRPLSSDLRFRLHRLRLPTSVTQPPSSVPGERGFFSVKWMMKTHGP